MIFLVVNWAYTIGIYTVAQNKVGKIVKAF